MLVDKYNLMFFISSLTTPLTALHPTGDAVARARARRRDLPAPLRRQRRGGLGGGAQGLRDGAHPAHFAEALEAGLLGGGLHEGGDAPGVGATWPCEGQV